MRVPQEWRPAVPLDEIDREIIRLLKENGRRPTSDMARIIGTSVQTISNRIEKLIKEDALQVIPSLNPAVVGYPRDVFICLRIRPGFLRSVGDKLAELDCVAYVAFLTGSFDMMIEVYLRDDDDLFRFVVDELSHFEGIEATETWTVLNTQKWNYVWSPSGFEEVRDGGLGPSDGPLTKGGNRAGTRRRPKST